MPRITYTPTGADEPALREDFAWGKFLSPERIVCERMTGLPWAQFADHVQEEYTDAIHALLFVLMKRQMPTLKPDQLVFSGDEIDLDVTDAEASEILSNLETKLGNGEALDEEEQAAYDFLFQRLVDAGLRERDEEGTDPKDPSTSEPSTSGSATTD
jgi:hypothetical protein